MFGGRLLPDRRRLIAAEEKELVAHERSAKRAAELMTLQTVVHALAVWANRGERILRIEAAIADELERVAREPVRAGLGHRIDRGARVDAVLRAQAAGGDAELLQRVGNGNGMFRLSCGLLCIAPSST